MRASFFVPVFALAAFAQEDSSSAASPVVPSFTGDAFPQTSFLTQTDSRGVVTGQPQVETSIPNQPAPSLGQPPVATSVGIPASIPAVAPGIQTVLVPGEGNSTRTLTVSSNNSTTIVLGDAESTGASGSAPSGTAATTTGSSESGASNASGSESPENTNAANVRAAAGGLVGAGVLVAAFL